MLKHETWRNLPATLMWLGVSLWVGGCAQLPGFTKKPAAAQLKLVPAPERFALEGRVSVKSGEDSFSGGMSWRHAPSEETLLLRTPLGQGVAELRGRLGKVSLKDSEGREYHAEDADTLVRQVIGMTMPITGLAWWVVGQPRPNAPYKAEADEQGYLARLQQDEWLIEFSRYALQGAAMLPSKLVAKRGEDLEIRLIVDEWSLP